jgi:hypothetical protein
MLIFAFQREPSIKKLNKEVLKRFNISSFEKIEINSINNSLPNGKLYKLKSSDSIFALLYIGKVNSCRAGGCTTNNMSSIIGIDNDYEFFEYFSLYDLAGKIKTIKVYSYQATHGQEICSSSWLKQFIGHNGSENLDVGKNIDAISGATISVDAITKNINIVNKVIKSIIISDLKEIK